MNQIRKRLRRREDQQQPIDELFSMEDKGPGPEQRVLWRERWAALLGSTSAVEPVLLGLDYPDAWVRASAATALGRLGSASAVEPLIRALEDPAPAVSSNAAASLGRLIDQLTGPQLEHVSRILIESAIEPDEGRFSRILPSFLRASFRTGDADAIRKAIEMVSEKLATPVILTPYKIAAEYLSSGRDPAILERQHPEMREAVLLLVPT
ncbi:MAG: HEAT repeat domain-containing protein [bacterium]|nr:HEAT repeat domain-containing protein [bacterium]